SATCGTSSIATTRPRRRAACRAAPPTRRRSWRGGSPRAAWRAPACTRPRRWRASPGSSTSCCASWSAAACATPTASRPEVGDRAERVDRGFVEYVRALPATATATTAAGDGGAPVRPGSGLTFALARVLFAAQAGSRHLDLAARQLRAADRGFYTIG